MTTFNELDHPRALDGTWAKKPEAPELDDRLNAMDLRLGGGLVERSPRPTAHGCPGGDDECRPTGARCTVHASVAVNDAVAQIQAASDPAQLALAQHDWERAMVDYACTPYGRVAVNEMRQGLEADQAEVLTGILARARDLTDQRKRMDAISALAVPVSAAPIADRLDDLADDENGQPLDETHRAWLIDRINTAEDVLTEAQARGADPHSYGAGSDAAQEAMFWADEVRRADAIVASATSTDEELEAAWFAMARVQTRLPHDTLDADAEAGRDAVRVMKVRMLNHPNAGPRTFYQGISRRTGREMRPIAIEHPRLPFGALTGDIVDWTSTPEDDADLPPSVWNTMVARVDKHPVFAAWVARHHPVDSTRAAAASRLAGIQWSDLDEGTAEVLGAYLFGHETTRGAVTDQVREYAARVLLDEQKNGSGRHYKIVWAMGLDSKYPTGQAGASAAASEDEQKRRWFRD